MSVSDASPSQPVIDDFNFRQAIGGAVDQLATHAHAKGIELASFVERDVPKQVRGDAQRLKQVVVNFVGNALNCTQRGGVLVRARLVETTPQDGLVRIEVWCTGSGKATVRGLASAARLVESMGGEIGFQTDVFEGFTFWFTVRIRRQSTVTPRLRENQLGVSAAA